MVAGCRVGRHDQARGRGRRRPGRGAFPNLHHNPVLHHDLRARDLVEQIVADRELSDALDRPLGELLVEPEFLRLAEPRGELRARRVLTRPFDLELLPDGAGLRRDLPLEIEPPRLHVDLLHHRLDALDGVLEIGDVQPLETFGHNRLDDDRPLHRNGWHACPPSSGRYGRRTSTFTRLPLPVAAARASVRIALMIRPPRPMSLPTSSAATRTSIVAPCGPSTTSTTTSSG